MTNRVKLLVGDKLSGQVVETMKVVCVCGCVCVCACVCLCVCIL